MDVKKNILNLIANAQYDSYLFYAIERLVLTMLKEYSKEQGKEIKTNVTNKNFVYDAFFPNGVDDLKGKIAVEIKNTIYIDSIPRSIKNLITKINKISNKRKAIDILLVIIVNEVPLSINDKIISLKENQNFDIKIWDINKVAEICNKYEEKFKKIYNNINMFLLDDTLNNSFTEENDSYNVRNSEYINRIKTEYANEKLVLFLGAGISVDAGIPSWNDLITELFVKMVEGKMNETKTKMGRSKDRIVSSIIKQNESWPLIQVRYLQEAYKGNLKKNVSDILYKKSSNSSALLTEIAKLCIPNRKKIGIQAIVNYNFDDLIEINLKEKGIEYCSVYGEGMKPNDSEIGVYHVHGFIPQNEDDYDRVSDSMLVFSEDGYHTLNQEPYNWSNLIQLDYLINKSCLFIGLSMTDPNLRKLLKIANDKRLVSGSEINHYAIMRKFKIDKKRIKNIEPIERFEKINDIMQEHLFNAIGVKIIWINDFSEIPEILKQIK